MGKTLPEIILTALFLLYGPYGHTEPLQSLDPRFKKADFIFTGEVIATKAVIHQKTIFTVVSFADVQPLKGKLNGSRLDLVFLGGEVGDDAFYMVGSPAHHFQVGDKVFLCIRKNWKALNPVLDGEQGVILFTNYEGIEKVVDPTGAAMDGNWMTRQEWVQKAQQRIRALSLDPDFRSGIFIQQGLFEGKSFPQTEWKAESVTKISEVAP